MPRLAYISFDKVPAPKGASTHIEAFTCKLAGAFGRVDLVTASNAVASALSVERWPGVFHTELPAAGVSLIDRVLCFRGFLRFWLDSRRFDVVQFRSIFEGVPLLDRPARHRLIFEVNGLPSVELKHRYPRAADDRELMAKLIAQERACLKAADRVVTPSAVTKRFLVSSRGAEDAKIRWIPNGVWLDPAQASQEAESLDLLYFGTLSSWQGIELAIRALAQIRLHMPARLRVLGAGSPRQRESLSALASKLGVGRFVDILPPVDRAGLRVHLQQSFAVLAPLAANERNARQGCCPLKILEGMASGVPVIASDLPAVRELGEPGIHFLLVKPGSVDGIAQAAVQLRTHPHLWRSIARNARAHVEASYTWERAGEALAAVYAELGIKRSNTA